MSSALSLRSGEPERAPSAADEAEVVVSYLCCSDYYNLGSFFERYWFGPEGGGCCEHFRHVTADLKSICILQEAPCTNGDLDEKL